MALTKVTKTGITDNAIDADKIEDGTVVSADIAPGTIENAKLANSSITVNGSSVSLGGSVTAKHIDWQSVITADGSTTTTAVAGEGYFIDTTSAAHTITLPASPSAGDTIAIKDYAGTFGTNALTIARNGNNIQGIANDSLINTNRASVVLVYIDATKGWLYTNESNVADLEAPLFITATGGTITTSGDYKIHTFTGDGCFVVSQLGNSPTVPTGGPSTVSYLVVAGGSGGGYFGGGGGAGGFREGRDITPSYTASPIVAPSGLTVSATTYPITVGAGGAGSTTPQVPGCAGSPSTFSTITSTGGGGGGSNAGAGTSASRTGADGGSGGGGASGGSNPLPDGPGVGGSGNTPPVSPPQGNNGGTALNDAGGGGGGATAVGANSNPPTQAGAGGAGATTSISGSPTTYAGGGGGGGRCENGKSAGSGGAGGGGDGNGTGTGCAGSANTGGGGGGGFFPGGAGGKGIIIIRYKYQ